MTIERDVEALGEEMSDPLLPGTGEGAPSKPVAPQPRRPRPAWAQQHVGTAVVGGVVGYLVGHWLGNAIASNYQSVQGEGQNDVATCLALSLMVLGWLV